MFGDQCVIKGADGQACSFLSFDLAKEEIVMQTQFQSAAYTTLPDVFTPMFARLPFADITEHGIHVVETKDRRGPFTLVVVTISCRRPPKLHTAFPGEIHGIPHVYRRRATALDFSTSSVTELRAGAIDTVPDGVTASPTFWNTFRWTFNFNDNTLHRFRLCAQSLMALAEYNPDLVLLSANHRPRTHDVVKTETEWFRPDLSRVDFTTRTLVEGLLGHGILLPSDTAALLGALRKATPAQPFWHRILESLFIEERIRDPAAAVQGRASILRRGPLPKRTDHLVMIRTVQITPTRVLVAPPMPETSNSVTRKYNDRLDAIIRVQFRDEGDRLQVIHQARQTDEHDKEVGLMSRVRRAMYYGINVGGRRYLPIASSSSQQKDHAMWFICYDMINRDELLSWMGTVSETVVAKHAARMGLVWDIVLGDEYPDIERNGHCFTDGCSIAGREVMRKAAAALGDKRGVNSTPSAIQFRLGGAKGVLVCWPDLVKETEVRLRPSQVKFESKLDDLNVVRSARYQAGFLNRQFIMIMSANGVPDRLFAEIFQAELNRVSGISERARRCALTKDDKNSMKSFTTFPVAHLIENGFHRNPLVQDIVRLIEVRLLQDLKWRARVNIPKSVYLIGVSDESGTLKEGEIFCQFQPPDAPEPTLIIGEVLVCRAPALHPGDVRRAFAVNNPKLHHLKNVIVFSTQGKRPLPNMLGGGDLDGDDFTVIWDQRFVTPLSVCPPMDYTAPPPVKVPRVEQQHLNENFVQYILNDVLGQVDNAHLAQADINDPSHPTCLDLAEIHSTAVDFAKTGKAALLPKEYSPERWPDFMGKPKSYTSEKILGRLFRLIDPEPTFVPTDLWALVVERGFRDCDPSLAGLPLDPRILDKLRPVKAMYDNGIQFVMRRHRVKEAEMVSGTALQTKHRKSSKELGHLVEPLSDNYKLKVELARQAAEDVAAVIPCCPRPKLNAMQTVAYHAHYLCFGAREVQRWQQGVDVFARAGLLTEMEEFTPRMLSSFSFAFWQELVQIQQMLAL
ncbi:hypothetical protein Q8F55_001106 [Vanrija albida]|uniref:RNA-dependent RNA polymerase n=1 Tax=Vanrija albida TaxID=181172 RepID=A0ABR3QFU3_9TREE